jgi:hypothetical protein
VVHPKAILTDARSHAAKILTMALNLPQRRTLGLALIASLCLHLGVGLSIFMPSGLFANTSHSSQIDDPSQTRGPVDPPEPPEPPLPESRQLPRIRLGIERSSNATVTWLGFESPTEHEVTRESEVEQAALAPDTSGGQASGLPDALTMVPTPVAPPPPPPPVPAPSPDPTSNQATSTEPTQQPTPQSPPPIAPPPSPEPQPEAAPAPVAPPPAAPLREILKIFAPESSTSEGPVAAPEPKLETLIDIDRPPRESTPDNPEITPPETQPSKTQPSETDPTETKPTEAQPSVVQPPATPAAEPVPTVEPATPQPTQPQPSQPLPPRPETPPSLGPRPAPTTGLSESDADGRKVRQRLKSEKESPAAALKRAVRFRPGQPAAVEGLDVKTVEPSFPTTLRFTSNPRNPVVVVNFNRRGRVVSATFLTDDKTKRTYDTGDSLIDNYLMTSLYLWTAKGKELEALPADNPEMVVSIVVEVTLR